MELPILAILLIAINIMLYVFGIWRGIKRRRSVTVYYVFLAVQVILLVMEFFEVGYVGGGDAMGNGMERGFLHIAYIGVQILLAIALLVVFIIKMNKQK